jgi:ribosome-associated translation inhibitor RaiA
MLVRLESHGMDLARLVERQVERRLRLVFGASAAGVRAATVHLRDAGGPDGAAGQRCAVRVALSPSGSVRTEATDADVMTALERAAEQARRAIRRAVERRQGGWAPGGRARWKRGR